MTIEIPLSIRGKTFSGHFSVIIDEDDKEFAEFHWSLLAFPKHMYAQRMPYKKGEPRKRILMHRAIMEKILGHPLEDGQFVDHRDGNGLNNTRANLRVATRAQNKANSKKQSDNKSGYKGVCWKADRMKWHAQITVNRKVINLGYFDDPETAYQEYCKAAKIHFGEFFNGG